MGGYGVVGSMGGVYGKNCIKVATLRPHGLIPPTETDSDSDSDSDSFPDGYIVLCTSFSTRLD